MTSPKTATSSIIAIVVIAFIIIAIYILNTKKIDPVTTEVAPVVVETTTVPADGQPATTTEVTPVAVPATPVTQ